MFHITAILLAALAAAPSSPLVFRLAMGFSWYHQLIDQGYSYRYYAPEPPPTPVVEARLIDADGRPMQTLRIPERGSWPRLRYQRELALANSVYREWRETELSEAADRGVVASAFARHLGRVYGCAQVEFFIVMHAIPPLGEVQQELAEGASTVDLDADRYYETPQWVGVFPCGGS